MNYYYFLSELDEKWVTFFKNGKVYQSVFKRGASLLSRF